MSWDLVDLQRRLTVWFITKRHLNAPAIWLRPQSRSPDAKDAIADTTSLNTDPNQWPVQGEERNLGVRLVDGHVELQIKAPDETFHKQLFAAFEHLHVDARAAYGLRLAPVSGVLIKVEEPIDKWRVLWPRGHKNKAGDWVQTSFSSSLTPTKTARAVWAHSTPLPGSILPNSAGVADLVVWRPKGKPAANDHEDLEPRMLAPTSMESICRAIAFATLAYWIIVYLDGLTDWDHSLMRTLGAWLARLVIEGQGINQHGKSLEGVCWAPIDDHKTALLLMDFLVKLGAGKDLEVSYLQAEAQLQRDPFAKVARWPAIAILFGQDAMIGIRRAFRAGIDIDVVERMSDQYALDLSTHTYLDLEALLKGTAFEHGHDALVRRHENDSVFVGKKRYNPFRLYAASQLRTDVQTHDLYPGEREGAVLRYSPVHGLLKGEDTHPDEYRILNTYRGFTIKPTSTIDQGIMTLALSQLDQMLRLLTRDNDAQMDWMKKNTAWTIQYPEIKQQVCLILVGGQGIGKSRYGYNFMRALFGELAGSTKAAALSSDNRFVITPFIGKLVTFIDEMRLESVGAINEIKSIVREVRLSGELKNRDRQEFNVWSRVIIATNQADIGLTPEDAADRAFYFVVGPTAENKRMSDREFQAWALTLDPFYVKFVENLEKVPFKQHLMRYFRDLECTRQELQDLKHSSRNEETVIRATMPRAREVARRIVADARVVAFKDISAWFSISDIRHAIRREDGPRSRLEPDQVLQEFQRADVVERAHGDLYKFKYGYEKLLLKMGESHNLPILNRWPFRLGDDGDNDVRSVQGAPDWRGKDQNGARRQQQQGAPPNYDPDYMPPEDE
jgi:hypothetical protein